jgi:hypothetical protein
MRLAEMVSAVHELAVSKGWWETPRSWAEIRMLVVGELSEALEEFRSRRMDTWFNHDRGGKPEGFFIEIADAAVRLMDYAGYRGLKWDLSDEQYVMWGEVELPRGFHDQRPPEQLDAIVAILHDSGQFSDDTLVWLGLSACFAIAQAHGRELFPCIELKHAYNQTRPYLHGGKAA